MRPRPEPRRNRSVFERWPQAPPGSVAGPGRWRDQLRFDTLPHASSACARRPASRRRRRRAWAGAAIVLALSCSTAAAQSDEGASGFGRWFDPRTSPFIPIPEVATDPNSGTSFGVLPVYLVTDEEKEIRKIYAPDIIYHPALGYGARFRVFGYPSEDTAWYVVGGAKERAEREFDADYATGMKRSEAWSLSGRAVYDRSATPRFFGIGNDTTLAARTNYTQEQAYVDAVLARNFTPQLQVSLEMRPRAVTIEPGILEQSIAPNFLGGANDWLNRFALSYDTRDSPTIPTHGTALTVFAGGSDRHFLSSISYTVVGLDARHIAPLDERFALATHATLRYMPGNNPLPFWALSRLGGDRSDTGERQPLRGFGEGRFVDRDMFSGSLELRSRVFDIDLFSQQLSVEAAPFIDAGRVFHDPGQNPLSRLHVAGGVGFRAIARPFIVGYLDIGYGAEGAAIFSGINYPF
jgi:Omp85 superfamily domain